MRWPVRYVFVVSAILAGSPFALAQSTGKDAPGTGSVSGTITVDGRPLGGIKVVALRGRFYTDPVAVSVTDANGQYRLEGLAAGDCTVELDAASFAWKGEEADDDTSSKSIRLGEGEAVEGVNIEVSPGGVITGRVTDSNGRPIIGETVQMIPFKEGEDDRYTSQTPTGDRFRPSTDDRGIYRAYGLPPGRYKVSVGDQFTGRRIKPSYGRVPLPLTHYSSGPDKSRPSVLEVGAGAEIANVDIRVARPSLDRSNTFVVSGRVVDDAGRPLPNASFSYEQDRSNFRDRASFNDWIHEYSNTDTKGEFTLRDLPPGKYSISLRAGAESPWFSDEAGFDVSNADVEGLEITAKPTGSISGIAVLEGTNDPEAINKFSQLRVGDGPGFGFLTQSGPIGKDGAFKIAGIGGPSSLRAASGLARQHVWLSIDLGSTRAGFEIVRVEKDGVEQQYHSIEVGPGESVSGVKVVVACYKGSVQGQITIEGGPLPPGGRLDVSATPVGQPRKDTFTKNKRLALWSNRWRHGNIDARGRFTIEHLPLGDYEINLDADLGPDRYKEEGPPPITVTKLVTVTGEDPVEITLVLDLSKKP
jgi:protocatechuate 3,4-dioxygenase beta subunit